MLGTFDRIAQCMELEGFDIDLTGYDCAGELEFLETRWRCPWQPGCGAVAVEQCPLMKRLATIARAPRRRQ